MTAPFSDELLSAYLDGELNAEERAYVEAQLRERADLRRLCDELRALRATLQALPVARPPENFAERVMRQAERQMLADSGSIDADATRDEAPMERPVEPLKRNWLEDPRWRAGIGVVAGLAACLLVMVVLYPPAALQNGRSVALHPDAISHPSEGVTELATKNREYSTDDSTSPNYRNIPVRGRDASLEFAENSTAPKSAAPGIEVLASEMGTPSVPEPSTAAPSAPAAPPAPMQQEGQTGGVQEDDKYVDAAAGEADSVARRMAREKTDSGKRELAADANRGAGLLPGAPAGGAGSFGALGDHGSMRPGAGAGMPDGDMRGGRGGGRGMGGGPGGVTGGLGGSMGGGGGMGSGSRMDGQPMPGGTEMRFGQAADAPADAAPSKMPAADVTDDSKYVYTPDVPSLTAGSPAESRYFALPVEPTAWIGTPVTVESLEQCTAQLEQARYLFVKVTAPEGAQEESPVAAIAEPSGDQKAPAENLFRKLLAAKQTQDDVMQVPAETKQNSDEWEVTRTVRPQVLVVDATSDAIRHSIDQLVSQPEVSVELAASDSTVAKQLSDQQVGLELRQQLKEEVEHLQVQPDMGQAAQSEAAGQNMAKNDEKPDGVEMKSAFDTGSDAERAKEKTLAEEKLAEAELAKDKTDPRKESALGRPVRAAGEPVTMPAPAAQFKDPAPVVERPSGPPAARSDAQSGDAPPPREAMAGKLAATVPEKGVAPERVTFYILYRLAPDPVPVAPPAPADAAGGR